MRRLILILFAVPTVALAAAANNGQPSQNAVPAASQPAKAAGNPTPPVAPPTPPMSPAVVADSTDCRMACAQTNYFCRASNDDSDCSPAWSQCVATCVAPNLSTAVSTAP